MYEVSDTIETQYHNSQASDSKKVLSTFGSFSLRVSKMTNPQLQRSNSRSYVILGDTQSPRRIDSLPYNSSPRFDKRAPMLGSVVERDSRGMSGSFG